MNVVYFIITMSPCPLPITPLLLHCLSHQCLCPGHDVKLHPHFIVTGSFLCWCVMRPASQRFFIHSCIYLRILITSYLATILALSVLMCRKPVYQSGLYASLSVQHLQWRPHETLFNCLYFVFFRFGLVWLKNEYVHVNGKIKIKLVEKRLGETFLV